MNRSKRPHVSTNLHRRYGHDRAGAARRDLRLAPPRSSPAGHSRPISRILRSGLLLFSLGAIALWQAPAFAAETACTGLPAPTVTVTSIFPAPRLDGADDFDALKVAAHRVGALHGDIGQPLGLTTSRRVAELEEFVQFTTLPRAAHHPEVCGGIALLRVKIGYEDVRIQIAREVARSPCLYDQVLRHENRHVRVYRELVAAFAPRIEADLRAALAQIAPVRGASERAVTAELRQRIRTVWNADLRALERETRKRHSVVDRPEEYRRVAQACGGIAARLVAESHAADGEPKPE